MKGLAVGREDGCMAARHVEVVDAEIEGRADGFYNIRFLLRADDGRAHADDADFFSAVGEHSVFHMCLQIVMVLSIV